MKKNNKFCQSCGMPIKKDPQHGGANSDGTKNSDYCSYCYQNGEFTYHGTVDDFQDFCKEKMIEGGHSRFMAWLFTRGMRRLERWKAKG
jgi:hypothetical protein